MNLNLFKELKEIADQQTGYFHTYKARHDNLKLSTELYELEDKGLIKLEVNRFTIEQHSQVVEVKGKIIKDLFSVV
jgi:hypothetical protein